LGASASSSSALRLNFDGSSGVERSKERSSLHRRKEKKRKEKKEKKKRPHLSKEVSSWSRKSSMSSPRSWAPRAESWVSRWRKSCWSADVSGDAPSKSSSSSSSSQPGRGGELLEEKRCGRRRRRRRRACEGRRTCTLEALQKVIHTPSCVLSRALFLLDLFERASKTLRKKRIRGTKGQG